MGQSRQLAEVEAPSVSEYFPGLQLTHVTIQWAPVAVEYVPAGQSWQVALEGAPTDVEYLPAPHATQAASVVAPMLFRYLPAPQLVHAPLPVSVLNFPAAHAAHGATASVKPGGHTQAVAAVCRVLVVTCPFGHSVQVVEEEEAEYVFKRQSVHVVDHCSENVPTGQAVHTIVST